MQVVELPTRMCLALCKILWYTRESPCVTRALSVSKRGCSVGPVFYLPAPCRCLRWSQAFKTALLNNNFLSIWGNSLCLQKLSQASVFLKWRWPYRFKMTVSVTPVRACHSLFLIQELFAESVQFFIYRVFSPPSCKTKGFGCFPKANSLCQPSKNLDQNSTSFYIHVHEWQVTGSPQKCRGR